MACAGALANVGDNRLWRQNTFKRVFNLLENPIRGTYTPDGFKTAATEEQILKIHGYMLKKERRRFHFIVFILICAKFK